MEEFLERRLDGHVGPVAGRRTCDEGCGSPNRGRPVEESLVLAEEQSDGKAGRGRVLRKARKGQAE